MEDQKEYKEPSFLCVLKGDVTYLEEIKKVMQEYVNNGLVTVVESGYTKEIHILTDDQWKEYQKLKECKEKDLIGAGFP